MHKSFQASFSGLLIVALAGCGSGAPDIAAVKEHMTPEQLALSDPIANSVGMVLVPVLAGEFQMGTFVNEASPEERFDKLMQNPDVIKKIENGDTTEEGLMKYAQRRAKEDKGRRGGPDTPQHLVKITKSFYLGVCEVTQQQYEAVMTEKPWAGQPLVEEGPDYAATYITWKHAVEFCKKLSEQENESYRLPTEAEWEYACRAGTTSTFNFGDDGKLLAEHAWHDANAYKNEEQYAHVVGQKQPNSWAVYDMHGNASEWCSDWFGGYDRKQQEVVDPLGPEKGRTRIWRGGSFAENGINMRSASRTRFGQRDYRPEFAAGFRVVRVMAP
jgi:formylglycine-generating enzyme required for sulfatase activity